jgi:hypothetical protein
VGVFKIDGAHIRQFDSYDVYVPPTFPSIAAQFRCERFPLPLLLGLGRVVEHIALEDPDSPSTYSLDFPI